MATQSAEVFDYSFKAESDLRTKQYHFVKITGNDGSDPTTDVCDSANDWSLGVLLNKPNKDEAAAVRVLGVAMVVADGSGTNIIAGMAVGPNAGGTAVAKGTADAAIGGIALGGATTAGAVIPILLTPANIFGTAAFA